MILDANFDTCNDLVDDYSVLLQVWPESLHYLYGCQEYLKDTMQHDLFWDATWCAGLENPVMYSTQSHGKTWHAQFCCTTRGIDLYVPACTAQLYTCQGTRHPICGYQSSNGMLQDSEFKCSWNWRIGWQMWRTSSHSRRLKDNPLLR